MIYFLIILLSSLLLLSSPIHCFYITNAGVLEQCSTEPMIYLNKFDTNKMNCLNQIWQQASVYLEYTCSQNKLLRIWTIQKTVQKTSNWPPQIFLLTGTTYTTFDKTSNKNDLTIEEKGSNTVDIKNNQLTTYLWTSLSNGPYCRIVYSIVTNVCSTTSRVGARLGDFICYYGKQSFNLITVDQRLAFDKLINDNIKSSSNKPTNNNHTQVNPVPPGSGPNPSALNTANNSFFQKYKKYIIIAGIIFVIIIIISIIFIFMRQNQSSNKNSDRRMSEDSNFE